MRYNLQNFLFATHLASCLSANAQKLPVDSLRNAQLDEVVVRSTRANAKSAMAFTNVFQSELRKQNLGQDIPFLLNNTPSVVVNSDAGAGVGYTGIRVRGSDATRVNVTINGVPLNDAESQGVYWVNMPDFASSVQSIQIQRGVGTSTNGAGAFGATLNVQTNAYQAEAYAETNATVGSFNTRKINAIFGTGLIKNKFVVDARLSKITSDGYIDRGASDLKSFYVSGGYYGTRSFVRLNVFSGKEITYQSWEGVPESLLRTNRTFNVYTYPNQVDDYQQDHYQLISSHQLGNQWQLNATLHYTKGRGFYEQFKEDDKLSKYALENVEIGTKIIKKSDIIRRRWLDNDFYGAVWSLDYEGTGKLKTSFGGGWNRYEGKHFGEVIWAQFASTGNIRHRYYDNDASKTDLNVYGKTFYQINQQLNVFADLQVRSVNYTFLGFDNTLKNVDQTASLTFFNPKFGLTYDLNTDASLYASYSIGNKEPNRNDYTESSPRSRPRAEHLADLEIGYKLKKKRVSAGIGGYLMNYRDQLVQTGQLNDVGASTRVNVPESYRAGVELEVSLAISKKLRWAANATFSRNKIQNFTEYLDNFDTGGQEVRQFSQTDIAFSPNMIASSQFVLAAHKAVELVFFSKYVGAQFMDNTSNDARKLNAFFVNDVRATWSLHPKWVNNITFSLLVNNILNRLYEPNGYTFSYVSEGKTTTENFYYPQAGTNFLAAVRLKF